VVIQRHRGGQTGALRTAPGALAHEASGRRPWAAVVRLARRPLELCTRFAKAHVVEQPDEANDVAAGAAAKAVEEVVGRVAGAADRQVGPAAIVAERAAPDVRPAVAAER